MGEFDVSSKFNGATFNLRWRPRDDGDIAFELMVNAFVIRLQFKKKQNKQMNKIFDPETMVYK